MHDLLGHLLMVVERIGCAGRGAAPSTWPTEPRFVGNDDWQAAWENAMDIACAAWADDTTLARATELPWATVPGALVVAIYTSEITVHTWDLAVATGQHPRFADDVVATSLAAMHDQLPVADRGAMWEAMLAALPPEAPREVPFANAVALDAGAPLIDQLVAWTGRDPALLGPGA